MKLIVCLDDNDGMLFGGRRQSKDRALRRRVLQLADAQKLWMNNYSAGQFVEDEAHITVDEAFLDKASENDFCFVENTEIRPYLQRITGLVLYRWNRAYPSDVKFPTALLAGRWRKLSSVDFTGFSHERITEEIYSL